MAFDQINQSIDQMGGTWVKLLAAGDTLTGELIDMEMRDRTDPEGMPVYKRGTQTPRRIIRVTFRDADGETRLFDANESAQRALADAKKKSGPYAPGGRISIKITAEGGSMEQATYAAKWEPAAPMADINEAFGEEPF